MVGDLLKCGVVGVIVSGWAGVGLAAEAPKSIWEQKMFTGDWGGARTALQHKGVDVSLTYIGGRVSNPANPLVPVKDAAVLGVRSILKF